MSNNKDLTLLYVEDEAIVALVVIMALEDAGFQVRHASDGNTAINALQDIDDYHALVTDVRLPHLDGWQIARQARELCPELPVVYVTGDSAAEWRAKGVTDSLLIQKPFVNAELVDALTALLRPSRPSTN